MLYIYLPQFRKENTDFLRIILMTYGAKAYIYIYGVPSKENS